VKKNSTTGTKTTAKKTTTKTNTKKGTIAKKTSTKNSTTKKSTTLLAENGHNVKVHYKGTLNDGTVFDSSHDRGTIDFQIGGGQMLPGFDSAVVGMKVGEIKEISLASDDAYGPVVPQAIADVPMERFPSDFKFETGEMIQGSTPDGRPMVGKIETVNNSSVTVNFNHPLAGEDLNFEIKLVEIESSKIIT
jgi:peptidylprolyl isomerase